MRMTLANYKKFQPYSYHRQPLLKKKKKKREREEEEENCTKFHLLQCFEFLSN